MKTGMIKYIVVSLFIFTCTSLIAQPTPKDKEAVIKTLDSNKKALEHLDVNGKENLFVENSVLIESGKVEGTYRDYLAHRIGPELGDFRSFKFENYKVDVTVVGDYAFATETYNYSITLKKDDSEIKRRGVATSVLKKENGMWKIVSRENGKVVSMHNSSRKA